MENSASTLHALSNQLVQLVETVSPAVAGVAHRKGAGSGAVIAPDGYILTNNHVVQGASRVDVSFQSGDEFEGRVLGRDPKTDLAVVRVDAPQVFRYLKLIDKRHVKVGQIVLAVGNPLRFERSVTWGLVSAIDRTLPSSSGALEGLIQTDAAINPGNSGGPLVSVDGDIVGINTAIVPYAQGLGFAVPAYTASWVAGELMMKGRVNRRYLGIAASGIDIPARLAKEPSHARGVYVHRVEDGSPAHRGGLKDGDILTRAEARDLWNLDDLQRVLSLGAAREIELEVLRNDGRVIRSILPVEHPQAA
jgi:S1-C subfamily serine protease